MTPVVMGILSVVPPPVVKVVGTSEYRSITVKSLGAFDDLRSMFLVPKSVSKT